MIDDCQEALNRQVGINCVTLLWVPGQSGFIGNDKADELAKTGAREQFIRLKPPIGGSVGPRIQTAADSIALKGMADDYGL